MSEVEEEVTPESLAVNFAAAKAVLDEDGHVDASRGVHAATGGGQAAAKLASRGSDAKKGREHYADPSCHSIVLLSADSAFSSAPIAEEEAVNIAGKYSWSPHIIAGCVAIQRSLYLRGGGPDVHSAGLSVMKDAVDGVLPVAFDPPPMPEVKQPLSTPQQIKVLPVVARGLALAKQETADAGEVREWLVEFYTEHGPDKVANVDTFMSRNVGTEAQLVGKIMNKYKKEHGEEQGEQPQQKEAPPQPPAVVS
jgi:hypothetical protein